jgi:hypothetical protein
VARALVAALIGTVHVFFAPRQAPLQERNFHPLAGAAVNLTALNDGTAAEQRGRHVIPPRELRTAPRPATDTLSRNDAGAKRADTVVPADTVSAHPAEPEHAPLQRTSLAPAPGVAVSARRSPEFHVVVQLEAHCSPGTSAATVPGPDSVSASGAWLPRRTSQAESCVSVKLPEWP